jgi:hypothetical protein
MQPYFQLNINQKINLKGYYFTLICGMPFEAAGSVLDLRTRIIIFFDKLLDRKPSINHMSQRSGGII